MSATMSYLHKKLCTHICFEYVMVDHGECIIFNNTTCTHTWIDVALDGILASFIIYLRKKLCTHGLLDVFHRMYHATWNVIRLGCPKS